MDQVVQERIGQDRPRLHVDDGRVRGFAVGGDSPDDRQRLLLVPVDGQQDSGEVEGGSRRRVQTSAVQDGRFRERREAGRFEVALGLSCFFHWSLVDDSTRRRRFAIILDQQPTTTDC